MSTAIPKELVVYDYLNSAPNMMSSKTKKSELWSNLIHNGTLSYDKSICAINRVCDVKAKQGKEPNYSSRPLGQIIK